MAHYLKISSNTAGADSVGLKNALIYIGKNYGSLKNKKNRKSKKYLESGKNYIAKKFGTDRKTAIKRMYESKKTKDKTLYEWRFHRLIYVRAYRHIVKCLLKCYQNDKENVSKMLNDLYEEVRNYFEKGDELKRVCSNALIYMQKNMLNSHQVKSNISEYDRKEAGKILMNINKFDRPLPHLVKY